MSADREHAARSWLAFAMGDLEASRSRRGKPVPPRIIAFNAQQAVEKALKAALVLAGIEPPRTHDLDELRDLLPATWRITRRFPDLARLSGYSVEARYPDDISPVSPLQAANAVRQAIAIVRLVREDFERHGASTAGLEPR
jgi:HEPN domain-containing protein